MVASFNSKLSARTGVAPADFVSVEGLLHDAAQRLVSPAAAKVVLARNSFLFISRTINFDEINQF
jgi:hypothetical protein